MPALTIRNIDEELKSRLRVRAAYNGRSMEEEARRILRGALLHEGAPIARDGIYAKGQTLAEAMHELFGSIGGVDLPAIKREPTRDPPTFD